MNPKIVTIGDLTADIVMPVKLPIAPGDSQQIPWYRVEPGGAGNFLLAGQRLGAQMIALGALGDDLFGRYVLDVLRDEGVNVEGIAISTQVPTTMVAVLFEPDAGKFSYVWHGGGGETLTLSPAAMHSIDQGDALFMQGFTLCEASLHPLVDYALASGKPIWYDVGPATKYIPDPDRARIREHTYALLTTEDELPTIANGLTGQAAYDFLLDVGSQLLVIKRGELGCRVISHSGQIDVPGFTVTVRDLVGAGDSFNAAFIYGTLCGLTLQEAAILANAAGGAKVQKLGTGRAMPTRAEIAAVLAAAGVSVGIDLDAE
ncbi:MAG: carbohydrate kinase family protein [Chloroflexota bacterium]